ncbi:hypothetical protein MRB53_023782 [Persea americana]|uniref:Uncharacterized protein n=1 Tax=Persea americana TaxID=3435 RepID=A0ACC2LAF1_PERAE|nr:hypothetical protein MRB53_023782 [Persea americana]
MDASQVAHDNKDAKDGQSIDDDVLMEIVSRLPPKPQTRFKSVSKTWHSLVSSIILHSKPKSPLSGLFIQMKASFRRPGSTHYLPIRDDDDETYTDPTFSFLPSHPPKCIVDSRDGFILLSSSPTNSRQNEYFLCNPVTRQWLSLPLPPIRVCRNSAGSLRVHVALVFDDPTYLSSREFKVIRFCSGPVIDMVTSAGGEDEDYNPLPHRGVDLCVDIYSSKTGQWAQSKASVKNRPTFYLLDWPPVLFDGAIYLSAAPQQVLRFDIEEESSQFLFLPNELRWSRFMEHLCGDFKHPMSCLGLCEGCLCYAYHNCSDMQVWVFDDGRSGDWVLKHHVDLRIFGFLDRPLVHSGNFKDHLKIPFDILAFHPSLDAVFIRKPDGFHWYDFQKGELETIKLSSLWASDQKNFLLVYPFLESYISLRL